MYKVKFSKGIVNKHVYVRTLILCKILPFIPTPFIAYDFDGIEIDPSSIRTITWDEKESAFIIVLQYMETHYSDQELKREMETAIESGWVYKGMDYSQPD